KTISYGNERPQCTESNELCWQKPSCTLRGSVKAKQLLVQPKAANPAAAEIRNRMEPEIASVLSTRHSSRKIRSQFVRNGDWPWSGSAPQAFVKASYRTIGVRESKAISRCCGALDTDCLLVTSFTSISAPGNRKRDNKGLI